MNDDYGNVEHRFNPHSLGITYVEISFLFLIQGIEIVIKILY